MKNILITNDDGIDAIGIRSLVKAIVNLEKEAHIVIVAPAYQRSGESKSLTFSKPLRVSKVVHYFDGVDAYAIDGTPADCVVVARHLFKKIYGNTDIDLIVSGINSGDNTSVHALLTSGTCAAAFEGAIFDIPAIAFSLQVSVAELFDKTKSADTSTKNFEAAAFRAAEITRLILNKGMPHPDVKLLNVNFPYSVNKTTQLKVAKLCPQKYLNEIIEDKDPRGSPILWIWGPDIPIDQLDPTTDSYILKQGFISVTPITLGFGRWSLPALEDFLQENDINIEIQTKPEKT